MLTQLPSNRFFEKSIELPSWLDKFIYSNLGGTYRRNNSDMVVLNWDQSQIKNYLGTYFPRSYVESYSIFKKYLCGNNFSFNKNEISLLDFGAGTGGEILGFATVIADYFPTIQTINITAIDGNQCALNRYDDITSEFNKHGKLQIINKLDAIKIDDFYDLNILNSVINDRFDIILSFKAICEFVSKQEFEEKNPYEALINFMLPLLLDNGLFLLVDISTKSDVTNEWLPNMMDEALKKCNANVLDRNDAFNDIFIVSHSRKYNDVSKIVWRLICSSKKY